jgi:NADH:ubiquinone oxidoreductase subunit D|tara:strand:- start:379 stop:486 length:108 start_codon:yes stop_codon:yes gene_type:complete
MQEMRQSLRIMMACLKYLPGGSIKSDDKKFVPPLR